MSRIRPVLTAVLVAALCAATGPLTVADAADGRAPLRKPKPGSLDPSFDKDGWRTDFPGGTGEALAIDGKGRIVVAGQRPGHKRDVALARILPGGKLDRSFGEGGKVTLNLGGKDEAADVAIAPGGRIVVVGRSERGTGSRIVVVMLGSKGGLAKKFGAKGKAVLDVGRFQQAGAIAVDAKGRIVVGGTTSNGRTSQWVVVRLLAGGGPDKSFGKGGKRKLALSPSGGQLHALALTAGRIVAAGYAEAGLVPRFAVVRLGPGGKLDPGFGKGGIRLTKVGTGACIAHGLAIAPGGRIVLAGEAVRDGAPRWAIARYGPKGHLDKDFGHGGSVLLSMGPAYGAARGVAVQPNGRILVAGRAGLGPGARAAVVRLKPDGDLHRKFGAQGRAILQAPGEGSARDLAIQANGRIVLTGEVTAAGKTRILTARLRV